MERLNLYAEKSGMHVRLMLIVLTAGMVLGGCKRESADELLKDADLVYARAEAGADSIRASGDIKAFFQPSVAAYEKVAAEYPGTPQAERALYLLGTIRNNDTREPEVAVSAFRRYLTAFPEGAQAPSALFLVGFIYNNELHRLDSAAAYKEFLDRFPQNEMATSAKFELEHLGKPAAETLPDTAGSRPMVNY